MIPVDHDTQGGHDPHGSSRRHSLPLVGMGLLSVLLLVAIVVIGGLITSTFLSLLVIPVLFTYVDDLMQYLKRKLHFKMD